MRLKFDASVGTTEGQKVYQIQTDQTKTAFLVNFQKFQRSLGDTRIPPMLSGQMVTDRPKVHTAYPLSRPLGEFRNLA